MEVWTWGTGGGRSEVEGGVGMEMDGVHVSCYCPGTLLCCAGSGGGWMDGWIKNNGAENERPDRGFSAE